MTKLRTIDINSFFKSIGYSWENDKENIEKICFYTKTRVDSSKDSFQLSSGMEQAFLIKAIAEWKKSKSFLEIGTGRGTACYAASLVKSIENIDTIDLLPFDMKRSEAIGYKSANVSNSDLYRMIPFNEKRKIAFHERSMVRDNILNKSKKFDLFFIDGNHTDFNTIFEDFQICRLASSKRPIFIWDDYYPDKFAVKDVIHRIMKVSDEYDFLLVESRGHIFPGKSKELGCGTVLMSKSGELNI